MQLKPTGQRVLVKRANKETITSFGLILDVPEDDIELKTQGEVVEVGKDVTEVKTGNIVIFGKYAGDEIEYEKEKYVVLNQHEILIVLQK